VFRDSKLVGPSLLSSFNFPSVSGFIITHMKMMTAGVVRAPPSRKKAPGSECIVAV
jgi:hypothetical protein